MIDRIIVEYLDKNKRLVVPGLGAFVKKDVSDIVFVEFLKKDDGVLSSIIATEMGVSADEAMSVIGNYVNVVSRQLRSGGRFVIEGLGELGLNANGVCDLTHNPAVENAANVVAQAAPNIVVSEPVKVVVPVVEPVAVASAVAVPDPVAPAVPEPYVAPRMMSNPFEVRPPKPQRIEPQAASQSPTPHQPQAQPAQPVRQHVSSPQVAVTESDQRPSDAQYSQSQRWMESQPLVADRPAPESDRKRNIKTQAGVKPKRKMDTVMLLAIIVAVIAIISLLYGLIAGSQSNDNLFDRDVDMIENVAADSVVQK